MNQLDEEKLFYERFWALHRNPVLENAFREFGIGVFRRSSVLEGLEQFSKDVGFKGNRLIEIGTCNGLTALVLSQFFNEVISIDVAPNNIKHEILKHSGINTVRFIDVRDNDEKTRVVQQLGRFDGAYVDGDHARDTETDFALVKECGQVLFHEYWEAQPPVMELVNRLSLGPGRVQVRGKLALWTA